MKAMRCSEISALRRPLSVPAPVPKVLAPVMSPPH
jgi:hypothetical protein